MNHIPESFKKGYRCILLIHRNKDGGTGNVQRKSYKKISSGPEEWDAIVKEFSEIQENSIYPLRIYASVNERCLKKAIHEFKKRQLAYDYGQTEADQQFYTDLSERFFSCIAAPVSRAETQFFFDCDSEEEYELCLDQLPEGVIILDYPTKIGRHIITKPVNPKGKNLAYHTDYMLFVK